MRIKIFFIACLLCFVTLAEAQDKIILNTSSEPPNSTENLNGICDLVLYEAFKRIGLELDIVRLSSDRAIENANNALEDGTYVRVGDSLITSSYPNLIQVKEHITRFEFVAFSKNYDFQPNGWGSLRPFHVGIVHGWKILEKNIQGTKSLTTVSTPEALFEMLAADRIDLAVYDLKQGLYFIKELGLKNIKVKSPPFATRDMYLYLHKKHHTIIPQLTDALTQTKKDGFYKKVVSDALQELQ